MSTTKIPRVQLTRAVLRGLMAALASASASPPGGDFDRDDLENIDKALRWIEYVGLAHPPRR